MIPVAEIFGPTIQGEGPHVGMQTLFVRVAGCDFNCDWCDSKFAWSINSQTKRYDGPELISELINRCTTSKCSNVVLTGGNPCLYDFTYIIQALHAHHITVDVETQGSKFPDWLSEVDLLVISPKAPSSKQKDVYPLVEQYLKSHSHQPQIAIKIPVFNQEDFEFAFKYYELVEKNRYHNPHTELYLSVGNDDTSEEGDISKRILSNYKELIEMIINSDMDRVFVLPQVHTLIWGNKQGV